MRLRAAALALALAVAATPVLGVVCEMGCDQPSEALACHESTIPDGPSVRGAHHACGRDHSTESPALVVGGSARDSITTFVAVSVTSLAHASIRDASTAVAGAMQGPPDLSARSTSPRTTVLRI